MYSHKNTYKKVLILGGSESGTGAALLAQKSGLDVFVSDAKSIPESYKNELKRWHIPFEENGHSKQHLYNAELIIKSPGIPDSAPMLQLKNEFAPIISEIEFASWFTSASIIGITGTNGKTTTTLLTGYILQQSGLDACIAGNVGTSFARALAEKDHDIFVLELSSFQLDGIQHFRPNIAVITNITPDHLDRYHNDFELYARSKFRITMNQTGNDYLIWNADDPEIRKQLDQHIVSASLLHFSVKESNEHYCAFVENEKLHINLPYNQFTMTIEELALQGKHNLSNSLAAGISARLLQVRSESLRQSLTNYKNAAHRLEYVANVHGVAYYNDSKATNVNSTWYALEHFKQPIIWIAGGQDKGNDYSSLLPLVKQKVKAIICLGVDNEKLIENFKEHIEVIAEAATAEQAVVYASLIAVKNDVVLLSPACASFDLFINFEDRGDQFKRAVKKL